MDLREHKMKKISFVATRPNKFMIGAWAIMKFMGSNYSHVAILFHSSSNEDKFFPYESSGINNVNFIGQSVWRLRNVIVEKITLEFSDEQYDAILDYAMGMCGEKYAYKQNLAIALYRINIKIKSWIKGKNCSELVSIIAKYAGLGIDTDNNLVTPREVIELLKVRTTGRIS